MYLRLNRERTEEAIYIFKMRTGFDGWAHTLNIQHQLLDNENEWCRRCILYGDSHTYN